MSLKNFFFNFEDRNYKLYAPARIVSVLAGAAILSFGIHNVHQQTDITEGGVLGLILIVNHWFGCSPAVVAPLLDILCYIFAFRYLGKDFLKLSLISTLSFASFFRLWEQFPPVLAGFTSHPLSAAILGGAFVGIGVGLVVRQKASCGGDDALALVITKLTGCRISRSYLATDVSVLLLSLTYIPLQHIAFSLLTVTVSSLLIDFIQNLGPGPNREKAEKIRSDRSPAVNMPIDTARRIAQGKIEQANRKNASSKDA